MKNFLELIRVKHWIKNFLLFIPLLCSKSFGYSSIVCSLIGFFSFSFACSFIYIVNDLKDIENDRNHPRKKYRPLPSGKISVKFALITSFCLLLASLLLNYLSVKSFLNLSFVLLISYVILNVFYSLGLKNVAIIDILILASGFVLRVYYGAFIIDVEVSKWLFLTILSFSLFMGIGKRRKELSKGKSIRKVLVDYNESFLKSYQNIFVSLALVFYSLWALEQYNNLLIFTVVYLFFIFMRYSLILDSGDEGDPITIIYKDKPLLICCFIYVVVFGFLLILP